MEGGRNYSYSKHLTEQFFQHCCEEPFVAHFYKCRSFSLTGRSLLERCLTQWGCTEGDSGAQEVERFCSRILDLGILQPFSDCLREPHAGSDVTDKPTFHVWITNLLSFCCNVLLNSKLMHLWKSGMSLYDCVLSFDIQYVHSCCQYSLPHTDM